MLMRMMMPFQLPAVNDDIDDEKKLPMIYRYASQCSKMLLMMLPSLSPNVVVEYPSC
jgi:hypothetical protein